MNGHTLRTAAKLMFGPNWRTPFCATFNIGDASLRRIIKDERIVPRGLARDVETALRDRANEIDSLLESIVVA